MSDVPFESLLKDLDGLVEKLEDGELSLEESLQAYENGVALVRKAQNKLEGMEERLSKLRDNGTLEPLDIKA